MLIFIPKCIFIVFYSKASDRIGKAHEDIFHQGTHPFVLKKLLKLLDNLGTKGEEWGDE